MLLNGERDKLPAKAKLIGKKEETMDLGTTICNTGLGMRRLFCLAVQME
jgi:hypothetical protein